MIVRQIGHFFFEPKTYDEVNQATHEYKESLKVGVAPLRGGVTFQPCVIVTGNTNKEAAIRSRCNLLPSSLSHVAGSP
jgi:hypothetical protein